VKAQRQVEAIAVKGVWKYFGDYPALREIDLTLAPGSCLALIGRNGAGKTTLLRILAGFSKPAKGTISLNGHDPRSLEARRHIGVLGHGISVYDELSAIENLTIYENLYDLPKGTADRWLERVSLAHVRTGLLREFSRGMRQRLAVARAFLHDPTVLILDEPFTSLDDRAIALLQSILCEARERGASVVMSTHQLREALELASDVALLQRGKIAFNGPRTTEMVEDPAWLYNTYGE
jgi:heme ABC exporter ATP-binding subunit CcmA